MALRDVSYGFDHVTELLVVGVGSLLPPLPAVLVAVERKREAWKAALHGLVLYQIGVFPPRGSLRYARAVKTASLPDQASYLPDLVPDPKAAFWALLEEFYSLVPEALSYGGSRVSTISFRNDEVTPLTESLNFKRKEIVKNLWRPMTAVVAGMVAKEMGFLPEIAVFNLYRDGDDYITPHSDPDIQFGPHVDEVTIGTVSFGTSRLCKLEAIDGSAESEVLLEPGSLFSMRGTMQRSWFHSIPKAKLMGPRLSLTFATHQRDPKEACSWSLVKLPKEIADTVLGGNRFLIHMLIKKHQGDIGKPIFLGPKEEAFRRWSRLEVEDPEGIYITGQLGTMFSSRVEMLDRFPALRDELSSDDPLKKESSFSDTDPHPDDIDLKSLSTEFLEAMMERGEAELQRRLQT